MSFSQFSSVPLCSALFSCLMNRRRCGSFLLYTLPPTHRGRASPGSAQFLTHRRGCRCPHAARRKAIGARPIITRMLQPTSPSVDLFPEFFQTESQADSHDSVQSFFFLFFLPEHRDRIEQGRPEQNQTEKITLLFTQTDWVMEPLSPSDCERNNNLPPVGFYLRLDRCTVVKFVWNTFIHFFKKNRLILNWVLVY